MNEIQSYGDNFIPVVVVETRIHTEEHPFCWNDGCLCHDDPLLLAPVIAAYNAGLLTGEEATRCIAGWYL